MPALARGNHLSAENVLSPTATAEAQDLEKSARPITAGGVEGAHTLVHIAPDLTYCRLHVQSFSGGSRALVRTKTALFERTRCHRIEHRPPSDSSWMLEWPDDPLLYSPGIQLVFQPGF